VSDDYEVQMKSATRWWCSSC